MNRAFLAPLVSLYRAAVTAKNVVYDRAWRTPDHLSRPVISIGNLSVGGSGKTPLVIRLSQLLSAAGVHVDVLSRGYGRTSSNVARVDPAGSAELFGDEPLLIAQKTGAPVYVGASRYAAGLRAEREFAGTGAHLLDDGFQHRKLARDFDIVVVHASDFEQQLLPAGRLREPLSSLHRASAIVLRGEDAALEEKIRQRGIQAQVWIQHRGLVVDAQGPAVAFCGIAHDQDFFSALKFNGVELVATRSFRDHHRYTDSDVDAILHLCQTTGARACVTTEKDLVRLSPEHRARIASVMHLEAARLEVSLADEPAIVRRLLALHVRK